MYDPYEDIFLNYTLNTDLMPTIDMLHHTKKKKVILHLYLPICTDVFGLLFHRWGFFVSLFVI